MVTINGQKWDIKTVPYDSPYLIDRTGSWTIATTDPIMYRVYISDKIEGEFKKKVIRHELAHCVMVSYNLLDELKKFVRPDKRVYAEEWICNFIADNAIEITDLSEDIYFKYLDDYIFKGLVFVMNAILGS